MFHGQNARVTDPVCDDVARRMREGGVAPLVATGWAARRAGRWREGTGGAESVLFDLASVTKPVLAVALARSGLSRADRLGQHVKEARGTPTGDLPLELLLAHRAGLDAHVKLYEPLLRGATVHRAEAFAQAARARRGDPGQATASGFLPVYSDLGYLLAGEALAQFAGASDPDLVLAERVIAPLGLEGQLGSARQLEAQGLALRSIAAPTEDVPWRGGVIVGRVHDENAWALSPTGAPGHAGLFGDVSAVLRFGEAVLDALKGRASELSGDLAWLVCERPGGTLRAGFDGKRTPSEGPTSAGTVLGARAFGHLGFTGTSLWIDPEAEIVVSVLSNRVHPTRDNVAIREARPWAHDALALRASK